MPRYLKNETAVFVYETGRRVKTTLFRGGAMEKINSKRVGVLDTMVLPDNVNSAVKQGSR